MIFTGWQTFLIAYSMGAIALLAGNLIALNDPALSRFVPNLRGMIIGTLFWPAMLFIAWYMQRKRG